MLLYTTLDLGNQWHHYLEPNPFLLDLFHLMELDKLQMQYSGWIQRNLHCLEFLSFPLLWNGEDVILQTLEKLILHQSVCREQNFRMSLRVIEIDITFSIFLLSGICAADKKMTSHVHSYTFCRIISGYLPFTKIGFANHPAENCNFVSQASMCSVLLKTNGSNQLTFKVIPTFPKWL